MEKFLRVKAIISIVLVCLISTAIFGSAYADTKTYGFKTTDGTAIIEAENMLMSKDATIISSSVSSGGKAVKITASSKNTSAANLANPTLYADINVDIAGKYSLYARVKAPGVDSNEFYGKHSKTTSYSTCTITPGASYTWVKVFDVTTVSGVFSIAIKYKEIGLEFDKIIFTCKKDFAPTGAYDVPTGDKKLIYNSPEIKPIEGHPRLFATKNDIEKIKENTKSEELKTLYSTLVSYANDKNSYYILPDTSTLR